MAKRELGPAALQVAQAVAAVLPQEPTVVGVSGGADSYALALGAAWAAVRTGTPLRCICIDHGLQPGSDKVAARVVETLSERGLAAQVRRVEVTTTGQGMEADAREARLAELGREGGPVLLGHTLDDQAEQVLLALRRGAGTRAIAGMAPRRDQFLRPLLHVRREVTQRACQEWGVEPWEDPHNVDPAFTRVRIRAHLRDLSDALGIDAAPALARTAELARTDADFLDELAAEHLPGGVTADAEQLAQLPQALRGRVLQQWMARHGLAAQSVHVAAVDALITQWHGQGPISVPGGAVVRASGDLLLKPRPGLPNVGGGASPGPGD